MILLPTLFVLQPVRDDAHALVGARRAAVRCLRDGQHHILAGRHGDELVAQQLGLGAGLPRVRDEVVVLGQAGHPGHQVEVQARRQHQAVVADGAAAVQRDVLVGRVDAGHLGG